MEPKLSEAQVLEIDLPYDEAFEHCVSTLSDGYHYHDVTGDYDQGTITASMRGSPASYGENILIRVFKGSDGKSIVHIESRLKRTPPTLMDWKNLQTVQEIAEAIKRGLTTQPQSHFSRPR